MDDVGLQARLPIGFAHRGGAPGRHEQNSAAAFARALAQGATGLESDVHRTRDGVPVLSHQGPVGLRRIARRTAAELRGVPTIDALYEACGAGFDLALDMAAPDTAGDVVAAARRHDAAPRLWLTYWNVARLARWREAYPEVRLVYPTLLLPGRDRTALLRRLGAAGVDALNVHHRQSSAALVEAAHEHGLLLFVWGLRPSADLDRPLSHGADGLFADRVPAMVAAIARARERRAAG